MVPNRIRNPDIGIADLNTSGTMACTPRARSSELGRCKLLLLCLGDAGALWPMLEPFRISPDKANGTTRRKHCD